MRLEGRRLGHRYKQDSWLFRDIDMKLESGEIIGLVGPSGCGKTTLGRILAGFQEPSEGSVSLDGRPDPLQGFHPVQMVFQHPERAVNPRWTINRILKESWDSEGEMLPMLQKFGVEESWLRRRPFELSGGELQRVCIVRALAPNTRFLIADEMTTMLDAITQAQIWRELLSIAKERQLGVLVVSHDLHLVSRLCDRVIEWTAHQFAPC